MTAGVPLDTPMLPKLLAEQGYESKFKLGHG